MKTFIVKPVQMLAIVLLAAVALTFFCTTSAFAQFNEPPSADAGPDVQADEGSFTQLDTQ